MKTELTAIVEGGVLKLDAAVPLPDHTRVKLTIEPVWDPVEARKAWQRLLARIDEQPVSGLKHYTREELYERD
jgi:predicted DNA-binding antitoxin AbrB/MazE fold protein